MAVFATGGRLAQYDTPARLLGRPADDFVADFVGSTTGLRRLQVIPLDPTHVEPLDGVRAGDLGATIDVDGILDGPIELTIPPGTQPGAVITLRGRGMPHLRSEVRGNLHAHVDVVVPAKLDHKDTELLRELKANRHRDVAAVRSSHSSGHAGNNGGLFSRLRETFSGC